MLGSTHEFWTATHVIIAIDLLLALGSLGTAGAALWSIRDTKELIRGTNDQVAIEQGQLDQQKEVQLASVMPLIVDVPLGVAVVMPPESGASLPLDRGAIEWRKDSDNVVRLSVPFRNVGTGPAFIHKVFFTIEPGLIVWGRSRSAVIPVGEISAAYYWFGPETDYFTIADDWMEKGHIKVGIRYTDIGSNQRLQSTLQVRPHRTLLSNFIAQRAEIYSCNENWVPGDQPFVTAELSD